MNALILKLVTSGMSAAAVAEKLRELASTIEREGALAEQDFEHEGKLVGTLRLPERKPALRGLNAPPKVTKPKPAPTGDRRCDLGRAIQLANDLEDELRLGDDGPTGIVLGDLLEPSTRIRQRLEILRKVSQPNRKL